MVSCNFVEEINLNLFWIDVTFGNIHGLDLTIKDL